MTKEDRYFNKYDDLFFNIALAVYVQAHRDGNQGDIEAQRNLTYRLFEEERKNI